MEKLEIPINQIISFIEKKSSFELKTTKGRIHLNNFNLLTKPESILETLESTQTIKKLPFQPDYYSLDFWLGLITFSAMMISLYVN